MKLRNPRLALRPVAILIVLALLVPASTALDKQNGDSLLFERTEPAETAAAADGPGESQTAAAGVPPLIDVWQGTEQSFGHLGHPQSYVNILGKVTDGNGVSSLKYALNGGAYQALSIGGDGRRLAAKGDFNIDIHRGRLERGANEVVITARDAQGNTSTEVLAVNYEPDTVWPVRYTIDWSEVSDLQDVAQVVDGLWEITPAGLRTALRGYDRLVAIGDVDWTDYEVTVPVTVHSRSSSGSPGVGILMRWQGHTDDPISGWQPKSGWYPLGALGWYRWFDSGTKNLRIDGNQKRFLGSRGKTLKLNTRYIFKMQVETRPGKGGYYRLKMWEAGGEEPSGWDVQGQEALNDPQRGSFLLLAHRVDATFGDVQVRPVGNVYALAVDIEGQGAIVRQPNAAAYADGQVVQLAPSPADGWRLEGWSGDDAGDLVDNGDGTWALEMVKDRSLGATFTPGCYTLALNAEPEGAGSVTAALPPNCGDGGYAGGTEIVLTAQPAPGYTLGHWQGDLSGRANPESLRVGGDTAVTAIFVESANVYQEGFEGYGTGQEPDGWYDTAAGNSMVRDEGLFQVREVGGNRALGTASTLSNIHSHYANQGSETWSGYRYWGRMLMTSPTGGLGVTFYSQYPERDVYYRLRRFGSTTFHLAAHPHDAVRLQGDTDTGVKPEAEKWYWFLVDIEDTGARTEIRAKVWPRGGREPQNWQVNAWHSEGGRPAGGRVGAWSYSSGEKYWDDLLVQPIVPMRFWNLEVRQAGQGIVTAEPELARYADGQEVVLTAVGAPGWRFDAWQGDLTGSASPQSVTMDGDKLVEATFVEESYTLEVKTDGFGSVSAMPDKKVYSYGDEVTLTATAGEGWRFAGWSGDAAGAVDTFQLTMDGHKQVTATFEEDTYSLEVRTEGEGTVSRSPDQAYYPANERVELLAESAVGWRFDHWEKDLTGDANPATLSMDGDKVIVAVFAREAYGLDARVEGNGQVRVNPQKSDYYYGDLVQIEAVAEAGWTFGGWSGDLSGQENPATVLIQRDTTVTASFEELSALYSENFEGYAPGADPDGWYDTMAGNSMVQDNDLFQVFDLGGNKAFGTQSTQTNIHSHYVGAGSERWSGYRYRGRMMMTSAVGGLGVTIHSQYADKDVYYRLRRFGTLSFHLAPHPHRTVILDGDTDTGVKPERDKWYWFVMEVEDTGARTEIRAKVWPEGAEEPEEWQVNAWHGGSGRLLTGRIGVWSYSLGGKYWDDLTVEP